MRQNRSALKISHKNNFNCPQVENRFMYAEPALRRSTPAFPHPPSRSLIPWLSSRERSWSAAGPCGTSKTLYCYLPAKCLRLHLWRLNQHRPHLHCTGIWKPLRILESEHLRILKYRNFLNLWTKRLGTMESTSHAVWESAYPHAGLCWNSFRDGDTSPPGRTRCPAGLRARLQSFSLDRTATDPRLQLGRF